MTELAGGVQGRESAAVSGGEDGVWGVRRFQQAACLRADTVGVRRALKSANAWADSVLFTPSAVDVLHDASEGDLDG